MREISFLVEGVTFREVVYNVEEFTQISPINDKISRSHNGIEYESFVCMFDIETTSIGCSKYIRCQNHVKERCDYYGCEQCHVPESWCYVWQFCIDDIVIIGRTLQEFKSFVNILIERYELNVKHRLVVYVHNLPYEYQFIHDLFEITEMFAVDKRKPLKFLLNQSVEFRCSYKLTNMSLYEACKRSKNCIHVKKEGEYDYHKIRYPWTPLSDNELGYCYCDVRGGVEMLKDFLEEDTLATIPLTSTGYVRREARLAMRKNPKNAKLFHNTELSVQDYIMIKDEIRGGNTHANRRWVMDIIENVDNYDISSSYPFQMLVREFPVSRFITIGNCGKTFTRYLNKYACLFYLYIEGLELKVDTPVPYITASKALLHKNLKLFNGRVIEADGIKLCVNEIDYRIIKHQYNMKRVAISDFRIAKKGKLPKELRDLLIKYYQDKTRLKGVDEYAYSKKKNKFNAFFGMCCTDIVRESWKIMDGVWVTSKLDIEKSLHKYYNSKNSFLPYQWGAWVTAYARMQLQEAIDVWGGELLYCDTDSTKVIDTGVNKLVMLNKKYEKLSRANGGVAYDKNGEVHIMGLFEREAPYKRFITYGAKKYACETESGELKITIAGVNKKVGAKELLLSGGLESLQIGFIFKDAGGLNAFYNDVEPYTITAEGREFMNYSNVAMLPATYTLGVTDEFVQNKYCNLQSYMI